MFVHYEILTLKHSIKINLTHLFFENFNIVKEKDMSFYLDSLLTVYISPKSLCMLILSHKNQLKESA